MNAMNFSNVTLNGDTETYMQKHSIDKSGVTVHAMLEPVIAKLAVMYPTWTFKGAGHVSMNNKNVSLTTFDAYCDDEHLGEITRRYENRDYYICITNDRIKAAMERSNYYKTKDSDKAVAKVKKAFKPKSVQELADKTRDEAAGVAQKAEWDKSREFSEAREVVSRAARKYVMGAGFSVFMEYVKNVYPAQEYELLKTKKEESDKAEEDLTTITRVKDVISGRAGGVVVTRRDSTYVVDQNDKTEICIDNTLPEWVRNRIGLLKLIEPGKFVSNFGMRASSNTFVVIQPDDLTDVTQGESK